MNDLTDKFTVKFLNSISIALLSLIFSLCLGCSHQYKSRVPAQNPHLESADLQSYYQIQNQLTEDLSDARKAEFSIISDNTAKFFLLAIGKSEQEKKAIFEEAKLYLQIELQKLLSNVEMEKEGSLESKFYQFSHPPMWTLQDEVDYLVERTHKNEFGLTLFTPANFRDMHTSLFDFMMMTESTKVSHVMTLTFLDKLATGDYDLDELFEKGESIYFGEKERILSQMDQFVSGGEFDFGDNQFGDFIKAFLKHYFVEMPEDEFKTIASEFINLGPNSTKEEMMDVLFRNCGPGLGKLLQQLGKEEGVGEEFKPIMEMLESNGKVVPYHLVKRLVEADGGHEFVSIGEYPLGTGTMAQVHKAKLKNGLSQETVALRFLKPGIEERVLSDIEILKSFLVKLDSDEAIKGLGLPNLDKLIESSRDFLMMELDIDGTIKRQELAYELYGRSLKVDVDKSEHTIDFKVPKIYRSHDPNSKLHVQEFVVFGDKFSQMTDKTKQKAVARGMFRLWFEEALFRSGFIHADLHQGNFTVTISEIDGSIKVHIFDYGMGETLPLEVRRGFILIGLGDKTKSAQVLADGIIAANLGELKVSRSIIIDMVQKELNAGKISGGDNWISWLLQKGLMENDSIGTLARGGMLISQLPKLVGDEELIFEEQMKMGAREYFHALANRDIDFPLNFSDGYRIGKGHISNSCTNLFRYLFPRK